tara:strand:- start:236 stop:448 length:213 start_codon:yes stop_codon:yes gene_type:complete
MTRKAQARPLLDAAAFCFLNATAGENDKGREWACLPFPSAQPTAFALAFGVFFLSLFCDQTRFAYYQLID